MLATGLSVTAEVYVLDEGVWHKLQATFLQDGGSNLPSAMQSVANIKGFPPAPHGYLFLFVFKPYLAGNCRLPERALWL